MQHSRTWGHHPVAVPPVRVRDRARQTMALVAFSAVVSTAAAGALMLVLALGGRA